VSVVNLWNLRLYIRDINGTVLCERSESMLILYIRDRNRTVLCECSESIEVDTVQKSDK